jgi:hypothetical protein
MFQLQLANRSGVGKISMCKQKLPVDQIDSAVVTYYRHLEWTSSSGRPEMSVAEPHVLAD